MATFFKPILVQNKKDLHNIEIVNGQYLVVVNEQELYVDKYIGNNLTREKVSQNIYVQETEPENAKPGDIWVQIEEEKKI